MIRHGRELLFDRDGCLVLSDIGVLCKDCGEVVHVTYSHVNGCEWGANFCESLANDS